MFTMFLSGAHASDVVSALFIPMRLKYNKEIEESSQPVGDASYPGTGFLLSLLFEMKNLSSLPYMSFVLFTNPM